MGSFARQVTYFSEAGDIKGDYVAARVPVSRTRAEMSESLTAHQGKRRRHLAWMLLIDAGVATYRDIAADYRVGLTTVYEGVANARRIRREVKAMGARHAS